ncbi:MAG: autotransporter-associated beta strand repeat-containing protein, partial [Planctomycetota bacterium]|nr:autotransporter-associated beta strand repeat-containing protein [Planctomycetota bacterium]
SNSGGLAVFLGSVTQTLSGAHAYSGSTTINTGTLIVDGSLPSASTVTVANTAKLGGTGSVGPVNVQSGGRVRPGSSPGILDSLDVSFANGSFFDVEIGGTSPGDAATNHDQLKVTGTVSLGNATLTTTAFNGFVPSLGNTFAILVNDGTDLIPDTFDGLTEGATISNFLGSGFNATITYAANTDAGTVGNDVVLTVTELETSIALDGSNNLVITDQNGGTSNDTLTIQSDTTNSRFVISDPSQLLSTSIAGATGSGTNTVTIPFALVAGSQIFVNTLAGNDSLTIDLSLGNFSKSITYDGGNPATGPADSLTLTGGPLGGGSFASVTHAFSSASAGTIDVTGNSQFSYLGLEPITDNLSATNRVFTFNGGAETITVSDDGTVGNSISRIDSTLGESLMFANPGSSLTINAGSGDDTINVQGLDSNFNAAVTINGDSNTDTVSFQTNATSIASSVLTVNAETVNTSQAVTTGGINWTTDTVAITALVDAGAGNITIAPQTTGRTIGIGTGALGGVNLTSAELGFLASSGTVTIGRSNSNGGVDIRTADLSGEAFDFAVFGGSITFNGAGSTVLIFANTQQAEFHALGAIGEDSGAADVEVLGAAAVLFESTANINDLEIQNIAKLAARTTVGGDVTVNSTGDVEIATVNAVSGVTGTNGRAVVTAVGTITVNQPVSASSSGVVTLDATNNVIVNASVTTASGVLTIKADNDVTSNSSGTLTTTSGAIVITADDDANANGTIDYDAAIAGGTMGVTFGLADLDGDVSGVISGSGSVTKTGAGTLTFAAGTTHSYTGATTVGAGRLNVNGTTNSASAVSVASGAGRWAARARLTGP